MKKGDVNLPVIVLSTFAVIVLAIAGIFAYSTFLGANYDSKYQSSTTSSAKLNQIIELSQTEKDKLLNQGSQGNVNQSTLAANQANQSASYQEYFKSKQFILDALSLMMKEIKAYNLHAATFSNDLPKIEINVEDVIFGVTVDKGEFAVTEGAIASPDIRIITTVEELKKIILAQDQKAAVENSFNSGNSKIEVLAGKITLMMKGYLGLYNTISGE